MNALDRVLDPQRDAFSGDWTATRAELAALRAKASAYDEAVAGLQDFAEHDCTYGDNCPDGPTNHGRCVGCYARKILKNIREEVRRYVP